MAKAVKHFRNWSFKSDEKSKYQVGPMFNFSSVLLEIYFVNKIYRPYIKEEDFPEFYDYHLTFFKEQNPKGHEREHFAYIWKIIQTKIASLQFKFSADAILKREKLESFQSFLKSIDSWGISLDQYEQARKMDALFDTLSQGQRNLEERTKIINEFLNKDRDVGQLLDEFQKVTKQRNLLQQQNEEFKTKIDSLEAQIKKVTIPDSKKIAIKNGTKQQLIHLFIQMRSLRTPIDDKIFLDSNSSLEIWSKMISDYFTENGATISKDTVMNYFKGKSGKSFEKVPEKYFTIK